MADKPTTAGLLLALSAEVVRFRELRWHDDGTKILTDEDQDELQQLGAVIQSRERDHFTKEEADALVGRRVVAGVDFSGVRRGTAGEIVATYENGRGCFFLDVAWEGIPGGSPHEKKHGGRRIDGFGRVEVLLYLQVLSDEDENNLRVQR